MGALVGLGVGVGLLLIWSAFALPGAPRAPRRRVGQVEVLLGRAGLSGVSTRSFVMLCAAFGVAALLALVVVSGAWPVATAFGLMAAYLPVAVVAGRGHKRQREFAEVWPEAVDNLAGAVRAGMSLPEALAGLGTRGPEPLRPAFVAFALDYQVTGRFADCLDRLKDRLADPVGDRVVEGLRVAREVGGGELGRLLRNLSTYLLDDARTRSELESRQAWTMNSVRQLPPLSGCPPQQVETWPPPAARGRSRERYFDGSAVASMAAMTRLRGLPLAPSPEPGTIRDMYKSRRPGIRWPCLPSATATRLGTGNSGVSIRRTLLRDGSAEVDTGHGRRQGPRPSLRAHPPVR